MALASVALGSQQPASAPVDLNPIIAHYKGLKNITFTVIHHGDIGSGDKDTADRVYWESGHFEINPIAYEGVVPQNVPKLAGNNGQLATLPVNGNMTVGPLDPGPDAIGAWEARGGLLLDWLMDGKTWKMMSQPQEGMQISYANGAARTWHDQNVREVVLSHKMGTYKDAYSIFVSSGHLVGTQCIVAGKTVWTEFRDETTR